MVRRRKICYNFCMLEKDMLRELLWLRQLAIAAPERLKLRGFDIAIFAIPPTPERHEERFRYRLLAIDPGLGKPILSIDLESDILGEWCLSLQSGSDYRIAARYDEPPDLASFRDQALALADSSLPATPSSPPPRGPARKRKRL
jgi:hypothetical protein